MPGTNGVVALHDVSDDDALDLGDLIPETRTVTVRRDGKPVRLEAYVYSTAPVSIYAKIAQAHDLYMAEVNDETAFGVHRDHAFCDYYKSVARALVAGLSHEEADNLGGDFPKLERMLKALGYPPPRATAAQGEAPAAAEAASTTENSSPGSASSTEAATTPTG
jgi:hypothetical protein